MCAWRYRTHDAIQLLRLSSSIARCGATPIFADIDPATLNLSPESAESVLKSSVQRVRRSCPFISMDNVPT